MTESAGPLMPRTEGSAVDPQRAALRASDADREQIAELLRVAAGEGRLDFAELDDRLVATYAAKTYGELEPLVADLVVGRVAAPPLSDGPLELRTRSGSIRQAGHWVVPAHIVAECTTGSIKIDFTGAECRQSAMRLDASVRSGSIVLVVPRGWVVRVEAAETGMGSVRSRVTDRPEPGAPTIHLYGRVRSGHIIARYPYRRR